MPAAIVRRRAAEPAGVGVDAQPEAEDQEGDGEHKPEVEQVDEPFERVSDGEVVLAVAPEAGPRHQL